MFTTNCPAIIITCPTGKFIFVGRVPAGLCNRAFATLGDAKEAAIDLMMETGETFAVDVATSLKAA